MPDKPFKIKHDCRPPAEVSENGRTSIRDGPVIKSRDGKLKICWLTTLTVFGTDPMMTEFTSEFEHSCSRSFAGKLEECEFEWITDPKTGKRSARIIIISHTQNSTGEDVTQIRIFNSLLKQIGRTIIRRGKSGKPIYNQTAFEKAIPINTRNDGRWLLIDLKTGRLLTEFTLSSFGITEQNQIVDIESLGGSAIVIQKWRRDSWIRIRIFGPNGTVVNLYDMPGKFVKGLTNGKDRKAIVTEKGGVVYQDMIDMTPGEFEHTVSVRPLPQNGIKGEHIHLQYDKVRGTDRFFEIVFDKDRKETIVRILNREGQLVKLHVFSGKIVTDNRKQAIIRKIGSRKLLIVDQNTSTLVIQIDLFNGRETGSSVLLGKFKSIKKDKNKWQVETESLHSQSF